jgi:uncharacterized membrane protein YfcA
MLPKPLWRYVATGLVGGFLSGFAGIGGGVVLIPMMVGLLGVSQHRAHGTSLAIIIPTAIVAATQYFVAPHEGKPPPLDLAAAYAATAVIGAPIGAHLISYVNPRNLRQLFGLLLLALAVGALTRKTPYALWGNVFLAVGLVALVAGTLALARRQRRAELLAAQAAGADAGAGARAAAGTGR